MSDADDARWLAAAAALSERGRPVSAPNPAVGAVLVKGGRVVGRGWTQAGGRPHAEAMALAQAATEARGATIYVTLEPCAHTSPRGPACADLLIDAGITRAVIGVIDPDPRTAGYGIKRMEHAGIEVTQLQHGTAIASLQGYLTRRSRNRPHITLKLALSLDGRIALADGSSQWITGTVARAHAHRERARMDAILVGAGTLRADAPSLDVRLPGLGGRSPKRFVLTHGHAPQGWVAISSPDELSPLGDAQYLMVEGGAGAAASFVQRDLVDRLMIYRAPILIGNGQPGVGDLGLADLDAAHGRWRCVERRMLGVDTLECFDRTR